MKICENLLPENLNGEIWKEIDGYNGDYLTSNFGRIKSFKYGKERILIPIKDNGYLRVNLCKNGKEKIKSIHILMFESFNNYKLKSNECVHHIDKNEINNMLDNFQLMTKSEHNSFHKPSEKTKELMREKNKGENHPRAILKESDVIQIRRLLYERILTQKEIGKLFGVNQRTISNIKCRKNWKDKQIC